MNASKPHAKEGSTVNGGDAATRELEFEYDSASVAAARESEASRLLQYLLDHGVIHPDEWKLVSEDVRDAVRATADQETLVKRLTHLMLINEYQASRIRAKTFRGLVLGAYRTLGCIGSGGVGIIFEAEHLLMRRRVAIKVLPLDTASQGNLVTRFLREIRAVAQLDHPHIVAAFDAGVAPSTHPLEEDLYYFVMEHLVGRDLSHEIEAGPLTIGKACTLIYQIAAALDEAHRHQLVHRDIKPPNIFVTQDGKAKLLDFGLVRFQPAAAITTPGMPLGTLDYMAPEQALDPTAVDIRTDIYSLGGSLYFALTGQHPFPTEGAWFEVLQRRQTEQPVSPRSIRAEIPEDLDKIVLRMMALSPRDRFAAPQEVMLALMPFLDDHGPALRTAAGQATVAESVVNADGPAAAAVTSVGRVVVAQADPHIREQLMRPLRYQGFECQEARDATELMHLLQADAAEVVLLAVDLPTEGGRAILTRLRDNPPARNLKIIMTTPADAADATADLLAGGADDCFRMPISGVQIVARVRAAVKHKRVLDRSDRLNQQLLDLNLELERGLQARTSDFIQARNALVLSLARLVEYRSTETMAHLSRMQRYAATLAQAAAAHLEGAGAIDDDFVQTIECCAPLHDIGNVGLPDHVVLKVGRLDAAEREIMEKHTLIGAATLQEVARTFGPQLAFIRMAIDIARHHHEHYDGSGYPDGLGGPEIPLAARIVAIADSYDALRSRRLQRQGLPHAAALQIVCDSSPGKFDPALLNVFRHCAGQFERIFKDLPDSLTFE